MIETVVIVTLFCDATEQVLDMRTMTSMIETIVIVTLFCDATEQVLDMRTTRA